MVRIVSVLLKHQGRAVSTRAAAVLRVGLDKGRR
jgi:hypothetical protein